MAQRRDTSSVNEAVHSLRGSVQFSSRREFAEKATKLDVVKDRVTSLTKRDAVGSIPTRSIKSLKRTA